MAYGKNSQVNPLTGRRIKPKAVSAKTIGGRKTSTVMSAKMRPTTRSIGRSSSTSRDTIGKEYGVGDTGKGSLGGGDLRPRG